MIPLTPLLNFVAFLLSGWVTARLYYSYSQTKYPYIRSFYLCFVFTTLLFLFLSLPAFFPFPIASAVANLLAVLAGIPLELLQYEHFTKKILRAILGVGLIVTAALGVFFLEPFQAYPAGIFFFWSPPPFNPAWIVAGVLSFLFTFTGGIAFMRYGLKKKTDAYILRRSILIGLSAILLGLTAAVSYIFASVETFLAANVLSLLGLSTLGAAMLYKRQDNAY